MMYDGLTDAFSGQAMGLTAENVAEKYHVTREEQDQFSVHSQLKAAQAQAEGIFADEIAPLEVSGTLVEKDEGIRPNSSVEKLGTLKTVLKKTVL